MADHGRTRRALSYLKWTTSETSTLISPVQKYRSNKLRTALEMRQRIENWPAAWALRIDRQRTGLSLLRFRDGTNVICRGGTRDWDVVHELMFAGSYAKAFALLRQVRS